MDRTRRKTPRRQGHRHELDRPKNVQFFSIAAFIFWNYLTELIIMSWKWSACGNYWMWYTVPNHSRLCNSVLWRIPLKGLKYFPCDSVLTHLPDLCCVPLFHGPSCAQIELVIWRIQSLLFSPSDARDQDLVFNHTHGFFPRSEMLD